MIKAVAPSILVMSLNIINKTCCAYDLVATFSLSWNYFGIFISPGLRTINIFEGAFKKYFFLRGRYFSITFPHRVADLWWAVATYSHPVVETGTTRTHCSRIPTQSGKYRTADFRTESRRRDQTRFRRQSESVGTCQTLASWAAWLSRAGKWCWYWRSPNFVEAEYSCCTCWCCRGCCCMLDSFSRPLCSVKDCSPPAPPASPPSSASTRFFAVARPAWGCPSPDHRGHPGASGTAPVCCGRAIRAKPPASSSFAHHGQLAHWCCCSR